MTQRFKICKIFAMLFLLMLIVTSNPAMGYFADQKVSASMQASQSEEFAKNSFASRRNIKSFGENWNLNAQEYHTLTDGSTELVIGLNNKPDSYAILSEIINKNGGKITNTISMDDSKTVIINVPAQTTNFLTGQARASGVTRFVEPNIQFKIDSTPNDPLWSYQWGPQMIKADYAWNTNTGSDTVLVAVVDTGIDYTHPDLMANYVPLGYDWVNNHTAPMDDHGHGTHCAGIIAATLNNNICIAGIAQVKVMAEKAINATGYGTSTDLANAIIHATDQGAKIISNSWGSNVSSSVIQDAITYATTKGVLVLASAGNSGINTPQYPGAYDEVICVTATDHNDQLAEFNTYGDWVDVAAPGVEIASTYPNNSYAVWSGTSMACPHAAGTAALIWSQYPNMTADLVRYQLERTSDDLGPTGFDGFYGHGRINAKKAVEQDLPSHDVTAFDWHSSQQYVKFGSTVTFTLTAFNSALSNETDVQLSLLVNNNEVNTTSIASLKSGKYASKELSWTPTSTGTYNVSYYISPVLDETITDNNILSRTFNVVIPPNDANWTLLANDPDEDLGMSLKAGYSQQQSNIAYFKVTFHRTWTTIENDINVAIMIDADRNPRTGLPDGYYSGQNTYLGADYLIIVGYEGTEIWKWNETTGFFDTANPLPLAYLEAPDNSSSFIVGVYTQDLQTDCNFDVVFCDAYSTFDWMPNNGYIPFIADKYPHNLAVTLLAPKGISPNETTLISAIVYNYGLHDEANVTLQILINGTIVNSATYLNLYAGTYNKIAVPLTPTNESLYNVTAYAISIDTKDMTMHNIATKIVSTSHKVALISDGSELNHIIPLLDSIWINYDRYDQNWINLYTENLTLLCNYQTVIFYKECRIITTTEQSTLNSYLSNGGHLVVTGWDSLAYPHDPHLADVLRTTVHGDNYNQPDLYVTNDSHPIMNGTYGQFSNGTHISGLHPDIDLALADTNRNALSIAKLANQYDKIIVTTDIPGKVVYWNGHGVYDWLTNTDCAKIFKNMMVWLMDTDPPTTTNDYNNLWHTQDFTIKLTTQDFYEVSQTYYKINNGPTQTVSADGQPKITNESSSNTLEYWSIDTVGNQETPHTLTQIKLDKTPPTGQIQINDNAKHTNSQTVTLTLTATDATSGVNQIRLSNDATLDNQPWENPATTKTWTLTPTDGTKTIYYQIKDNAGLISPIYNTTIILDTPPPIPQKTSPIPTPTPSPKPTQTPTTKPTPTPTLNPATIQATINNTTTSLSINGNITASQITNATITTNQSSGETTISFTLTGETGTTGFSNITIPKSILPNATTPLIYIDNQICQDQGYTQDTNNYYAWYTTQFSTHKVTITFAQPQTTQELPLWLAITLVTGAIACLAIALTLKKQTKTNYTKTKKSTN